MIMQKVLHSFKNRKIKSGTIAIKLDLQKAYDRMNWSFLKEVLLRFGFNETFTSWIMACVTTVSFKVLINGGKSDQFKPGRGVR